MIVNNCSCNIDFPNGRVVSGFAIDLFLSVTTTQFQSQTWVCEKNASDFGYSLSVSAARVQIPARECTIIVSDLGLGSGTKVSWATNNWLVRSWYMQQ